MIRPAAFGRNEVTRPSNHFQTGAATTGADRVAAAAKSEFDNLAAQLLANGIDVRAFPGRMTSELPDEVFPNNWCSTHADGTLVLYPLMAWNRRPERRRDIIDELQQHTDGFRIERVVDLSNLEQKGLFLEGTGSLVLDRANRVGFACLSPRTHLEALEIFAQRLDYEIVAFHGLDRHDRAIYHTNVMLALGEGFAVVCLEAIREVEERFRIHRRLELGGREVIDIGYDQLHAFAGNLIELRNRRGSIIFMSAQAHASLTSGQREALTRHAPIVTAHVNVIERFGGGSVRCMLAELLLPRK